MKRTSLAIAFTLLAGMGSLVFPSSARSQQPAQSAQAQQGTETVNPAGPQTNPDAIVGRVNGEPITRKRLGEECLMYFGQDITERMVNKYLILTECKRLGIVITRDDIKKEIERMASSFKLPVTQWLTLLRDERGINEQQYSEDIVWPSLAMKAIAKEQIQVSETEVQESYERNFGPQIQARIIVLDNMAKAKEVRQMAVENPSRFSALAKQYSIDTATASAGGRTPTPLRNHSGNDEFDKLAFSLKPNEISNVFQVGNQYIIVLCEEILPGTMDKYKLEDVADGLREELTTRNLAKASEEIFQRLQQTAKVVMVLGNPKMEQTYPTAAVLINNAQINRAQVAEKAVERHGSKVLNGLIQWTITEQAAKKAGITVTEQEIDAEVERIAKDCLPPKADGSADVERWYQSIAKDQQLSRSVYRKNLWPVLVLRKMVADQVRVEQDDLQKGYEANFGPRVIVRAIILNDMRTAQRVWGEARKEPTESHFGDLCQQYSIDPNSRAIRGEVPPIQKYGGLPELEDEAFKLKKGELSDIIAVGRNFVILLCLGQTEPENIPFEQVKDEIAKDVRAKKEQVLISEKVEELVAAASWENLLTGETQSPKSVNPAAEKPQAAPRSGSVTAPPQPEL